MAAGNVILFNTFREYVADGTIDLDTHTFKVQLHSSTFVPSAENDAVRADLSDELATAVGYTAAGATLANVTWTRSTTTVTLDADNVTWTAAGVVSRRM